MTNLEKYLDKILEMGARFVVNKDTSELTSCDNIICEKCLFHCHWAGDSCTTEALYWLFEEAD